MHPYLPLWTVRVAARTVVRIVHMALCVVAFTGTAVDESRRLCSDTRPNGTEVWHVVPATAFYDQANTWDPGVEEFPADVSVSAQRAKDYLVQERGFGNNMFLVEVDIEFARSIQRRSIHAKLTTRTHECWYMRFTFTGLTRQESRTVGNVAVVVMLLDGTIAQEQPQPKSK
jgi:hypothetical protein